MGRLVSYTSFDHNAVTIVPVIASFDADGHVCPLYVRIGRSSYHIESYFVNSKYSNITEFRCKIADGDSLKPLMLSYYSVEGMWTVPHPADSLEGSP